MSETLPFSSTEPVGGLRRHTVRGGAVTLGAQGLKFMLSLLSTVVLARLLSPADYGLIAMAVAFTGFVEILRDGGLSLATVQREHLDPRQVTTLLWLNVGLGAALTAITFIAAPAVAVFYREPRLTALLAALGTSFFLGGLGVQHTALLRRDLRYNALAALDALAAALGVVAALALCWFDAGPWALVALTIVPIGCSSLGAWWLQPWRPAAAASLRSVRPLLGFGGDIVATRFLYQFVRGSPGALLGWAWGAASAGLYQRGFSLLMVAVDQIQGPVSSVALPPLSRLQPEHLRLRAAFLATYRVTIAAILPVLAVCAVFASEIVALLLGPKWAETAVVFRWLAVGGIALGLLSPQGLLLLALGQTETSKRLAALDAAGVTTGYLGGLHWGAPGVALGYCVAKCALALPLTMFTFRRTPVAWRDVVAVMRAPLAAAACAAGVGLVFQRLGTDALHPPLLGLCGGTLMFAVYAGALLGTAGEWAFYAALWRDLRRTPAVLCP